jgi:CRP-like cAMP-binding protein
MAGEQLFRYPLFRLLSPRQCEEWLAAGQEIDCASGVTLFQENTPGAWVHFVREGRVRILRQSGWREISLGMLLPGDAFGEYALLPPRNNTATCRTAAPSKLLRLPLAPLQTALDAMPAVYRNLKNWLRLHTLLHFRRERTFLGFMAAESGLKLHDRLKAASFLAGQISLTCHAVRVSLDRLGQVNLPAIAHISDGHYVVLHELEVGGVVIGDPATGIVTWNPESLARSFSGVLLLFDKV